MKKIEIKRLIYMTIIILIIISGYAFSKSKGLVTKGELKDTYVTEQLTTGSDDNIVIEFSILLFLPMIIISIFRITKSINLFEYLSANLISLLQLFLLFCNETGSILNTLVYNYNIPLWIWVISFILFIIFTQFYYLRNKQKIKPPLLSNQYDENIN